MDGPYHPDLYATDRDVESWWAASAPPAPPRPALEGDARADVAIIGAGYAGLACARALAEAGVEVVLLDAGAVGWGASGRAGGIVGLGGDRLGAEALLARFGEAETAAYVGAQVDEIERLRAFCAEQGVETQGEAEAFVALTRRAWRRLRAKRGRFGVEVEPLPRDAFAERGFDSPRQQGALMARPSFGVHPLALARALAAEAERAGARVLERSCVLAWRREGAEHRLETAAASLRARRVVLAANGFTPDGLHPAFRGRAMPVISMIGVTRPLTAEERGGFRLADPFATDRRLLYYARMLPQGRLLFGMRGDLSGAEADAPRLRRRLRAHMDWMFPQWRDVALEFFWRGPVCMTRAQRPAVGRLEDDAGVFHAFAWHGSGVAAASAGGRLLAGLMLGANRAIPAPFAGLPPRIPLPGLRRLQLRAALTLYRGLDALDG